MKSETVTIWKGSSMGPSEFSAHVQCCECKVIFRSYSKKNTMYCPHCKKVVHVDIWGSPK